VELLTGALFLLGVVHFGPTRVALKFLYLCRDPGALIVTDFEERILPDEFTLGGTIAGLVLAAFIPMAPGLMAILLPSVWDLRLISVLESAAAPCSRAASCGDSVRSMQKIRHREGLGFGDVKMVMMMGTFFRHPGYSADVDRRVGDGKRGGFDLYLREERRRLDLRIAVRQFSGIAALGVALYAGPSWPGMDDSDPSR